MSQPLHRTLADLFVAEEVAVVFGLLGDGNMLWMTSMAEQPGVTVVHARHENAAVAMATAYAEASGRVGVCSVTCGPGITQIPTSLTLAVRRRTPVVVLAGDVPRGVDYHLQSFDPGPLVAATGARHIPLRDASTAHADVQAAFVSARYDRRPAVLTVPYDVQEQLCDNTKAYRPVTTLPGVTEQVMCPDAGAVEQVRRVMADSQRPLILVGKGGLMPDCRATLVSIAEHTGALLATTLSAKGAFDGCDFDVGIAGGYSPSHLRSLMQQSDCVLAVGASLSHYTTLGGALFPDATVIQVDRQPAAYNEGAAVPDLLVRGDASTTSSLLLEALRSTSSPREGRRTAHVRSAIEAGGHGPDYELETGTLDPRIFFAGVNEVLPKDWFVVTGAGHFSNFAIEFLRGYSPEDQLFTSPGFGAIGQGIGAAVGVSLARPAQKVVLVEGDGSLLMNIQELETVARGQLDICIMVLNDGAYGAEVHKLRSYGISEAESIFGRPDFAAIARGFGIDGIRVDGDHPDVSVALDQFASRRGPLVVDVHISRTVPSIRYRRL